MKKDFKKGIATLEIVLALAIIVSALTAVTLVISGSESTNIDSQTNQEAIYKAEQALEKARNDARTDFSSVVSNSTPDPFYTQNLNVSLDSSDPDGLTKIVKSIVTWGSKTIELQTKVTDWNSAGGICNPVISGDWTSPQSLGYFDFPSSAGATGVSIKKNIAYVVSDPSSAAKDDFYVIDVKDPTIKPLPKLGSFSTKLGLTDIVTIGDYSFVTANSTGGATGSYKGQLLVIDSSNPGTLTYPGSIKAYLDLTPISADTAIGNTIFYANKRIYVGLTKSSSAAEFRIFDVSTPTAPSEIGSGYEVGSAVNKIIVRNNIAYLATAGAQEIIALDVSGSAPVLTDNYNSSTLTGQSLALDNTSQLYFGRIGGTGNPKLLAFDASNLTSPKWTMNMVSQSGIFTEILRKNLLFMTTSDPNDGLQIWNIGSAGPGVPPIRYDTDPLNIQQNSTAGSTCVGNLLYIAQRSNRALQIVGPYVPVPFDYSFSTKPSDVTLSAGGSSQINTFTITRTSGTSQVVNFTNSVLPAGVTMNYSSISCKPNCSSTLTLSASSTATLGTHPITIFGDNPAHSVTFNATINPGFTYTISNPGVQHMVRPIPLGIPITITKVTGTSIPVTLSMTNLPSNASLTSTSPATCTPNPSCTITFNFNASSGANKSSTTNVNAVTATATNSPQTFLFTVN
jgi:hypothetical protein